MEHIMTFRTSILAALALALPLSTIAAESGHDNHAAQAKHTLQLNAGKKWTTDDALRKGMTSIRSAIASALPEAHAGKMTTAEYDALAGQLGGQVGYIVQNCKLDPKADAQLHVVIGDIGHGIEVIEGKAAGTDRAEGMVAIAQALNRYGKYFNHAGWQPVALAH
jgi:hypothetical protein